MAQKVFNRYEKKYLLDPHIYKRFIKEVEEYMEEDCYGLHTIRNIYFDTDQNELIRTSIEKPKYKEKFRIRCYGMPRADTDCFLEIKKKYKGLVNKRRIVMSMEQAGRFLAGEYCPEKKEQISHEIQYFLESYELSPKRYIAYDRVAYYGKENPEFRVTFDEKIRSRSTNLTLYSDEDTEELLEPGYRLMEVKVDGAIPLWFVRLLTKYEVYSISFSKYGRFYMREEEIKREQCKIS